MYHLEALPNTQMHSKEKHPSEIQGVLQQYAEVFEEPKSLPPVREVDH